MSKELNVLLQRIHPVVKLSEEIPEPSRNLLRLVNRVENRRWFENELIVSKERLKEARNELKMIRRTLDSPCNDDLILIQLDIERYLGRDCPWYLNCTNEGAFDDEDWEDLPELYKDLPRINNYKIGSYWSGSSDDTIRFIKDRLKWAQKTYEEEVRVVRKFLRALKKWDLESDLPAYSYIDFLGWTIER